MENPRGKLRPRILPVSGNSFHHGDTEFTEHFLIIISVLSPPKPALIGAEGW